MLALVCFDFFFLFLAMLIAKFIPVLCLVKKMLIWQEVSEVLIESLQKRIFLLTLWSLGLLPNPPPQKILRGSALLRLFRTTTLDVIDIHGRRPVPITSGHLELANGQLNWR